MLRSIKCSLNEKVSLPSWDSMAKYWKKEIIPDIRYVWREEPRDVCGVITDPALFIPLHMKRFLERMELEGKLPVPGSYKIEIKV